MWLLQILYTLTVIVFCLFELVYDGLKEVQRQRGELIVDGNETQLATSVEKTARLSLVFYIARTNLRGSKRLTCCG
jgi:hypothetical protein